MNALTIINGQYLDISFNGDESCSYRVIDCKPDGKSAHLRVYTHGGDEPQDIQIRPHPVEYPEGGWKHHIPDRDMVLILIDMYAANAPIVPKLFIGIVARYHVWKAEKMVKGWNEMKKLRAKHEAQLRQNQVDPNAKGSYNSPM